MIERFSINICLKYLFRSPFKQEFKITIKQAFEGSSSVRIFRRSPKLLEMDEYIGMTVLVTLQDPPHAEIRGTVTNIVAQQLHLSPGKVLELSQWIC